MGMSGAPDPLQKAHSERQVMIAVMILAVFLLAAVVGAVAWSLRSGGISSVASRASPNIHLTKFHLNSPFTGDYDYYGNCQGEYVYFTFTLTNTGADGYATIIEEVDNQRTYGGTSHWVNTFMVHRGEALPVSGQDYIRDCQAHYVAVLIDREWSA